MAGFRRPHRNFKVHRKYWDLYVDLPFPPFAPRTRTPCSALYFTLYCALTVRTAVVVHPKHTCSILFYSMIHSLMTCLIRFVFSMLM